MSHAQVFAGIYAKDSWFGGSGPGSAPAAAAPYCRFIERYVRRYSISTVLDLGCGDLRIARAIDWGPAMWCGIDVVATDPAVFTGDIRTCPWPGAELVLLKDVLQHWPLADITALLPRLHVHPHVLITNSASGKATNAEIAVGDVRSLDLAAEPFRWPVREVLRWAGDEVKSTVALV